MIVSCGYNENRRGGGLKCFEFKTESWGDLGRDRGIVPAGCRERKIRVRSIPVCQSGRGLGTAAGGFWILLAFVSCGALVQAQEPSEVEQREGGS